MNAAQTSCALDELCAAQATGDPRMIASTASRQIFRLYAHHYDALVEAVRALPSEVLPQHPALYLVYPWIGVATRSTRPLDVSVFDSYRGLPGEERATATVLKLLAVRHTGDLQASVALARQLSELIARGEAGDPGDATGPLWYFHSQIGSALLCAGSTSAALREFALARQYAETFGLLEALRVTAGRTAVAHAVRGSVEEAERALQSARTYPDVSFAFRENAAATELIAETLLAVDRMAPDAGDRIAALDALDGAEVVWPFVFLARTRYLLAIP